MTSACHTITASVISPVSTFPEKVFKCNYCELGFENNRGLKIHIGKAHKMLKERSTSVAEEPMLTLIPTQVSGRVQEDETNSPEKLSDGDELVHKTFGRDELWCRKCEEEEGPACDEWDYLLPNRPAMKAHMHNEHKITIFEDINIDSHGGFRYYRIPGRYYDH